MTPNECTQQTQTPVSRVTSFSAVFHGRVVVRTFGGFHTWGYHKMDGVEWEIPLRWMILGYPHLRKLPCNCSCSWESFRTKWRLWTDTKDLKDVLREFRQQRLLFAMASKCFKSLRDIFPCPSPAPPHTPPHLASQPSQF